MVLRQLKVIFLWFGSFYLRAVNRDILYVLGYPIVVQVYWWNLSYGKVGVLWLTILFYSLHLFYQEYFDLATLSWQSGLELYLVNWSNGFLPTFFYKFYFKLNVMLLESFCHFVFAGSCGCEMTCALIYFDQLFVNSLFFPFIMASHKTNCQHQHLLLKP